MTSHIKEIDVSVADGRPKHATVVGVDYPSSGLTVYDCVLNPDGCNDMAVAVPVQNSPYALEGSARGLPLEALYAILKYQLQIERHTVSPAKAEMLDACIGLLDGSRDILLGVNAVPQSVGDIHA